MADITLQQLNKKNGQVITQDDIKKNETSLEIDAIFYEKLKPIKEVV